MANYSSKISIYKKVASLPADAESFLRLSEYCKKKFVTAPIVRRQIQGNKIRAFFLNGRWYVKEFEDSQYIRDYP